MRYELIIFDWDGTLIALHDNDDEAAGIRLPARRTCRGASRQ